MARDRQGITRLGIRSKGMEGSMRFYYGCSLSESIRSGVVYNSTKKTRMILRVVRADVSVRE
jgi:hypothetical protein